ncbi:hypothetical protein SDC9_106610 [bioreactor metagenome]|uniref:Uncharacterized protein n=1 Tax=bioreactor metagenome TaxID=1076179 RepID=A0A645BDI3_9ZZZZ
MLRHGPRHRARAANLCPQSHRHKILHLHRELQFHLAGLRQITQGSPGMTRFDPPMQWPQQPQQSLEEGGFSASIRPHDGRHRALRELTSDVAHGHLSAITQAHVLQRQIGTRPPRQWCIHLQHHTPSMAQRTTAHSSAETATATTQRTAAEACSRLTRRRTTDGLSSSLCIPLLPRRAVIGHVDDLATLKPIGRAHTLPLTRGAGAIGRRIARHIARHFPALAGDDFHVRLTGVLHHREVLGRQHVGDAQVGHQRDHQRQCKHQCHVEQVDQKTHRVHVIAVATNACAAAQKRAPPRHDASPCERP